MRRRKLSVILAVVLIALSMLSLLLGFKLYVSEVS